jgi:A/G-specific adenine glycosylase
LDLWGNDVETRKLRRLVRRLLSWFSRHARDLPWRRTRDPYAIWVSEIMLQQTQVKTVIPYWERWMRALPDVRSVAAAPPAQVLKLWEGLGYYSRVRNLQQAARAVVQTHGGRFPARFEDLLALPGVGRYTAGAICSIAFNQPRGVLDGNVTRVLCRIFGIDRNPQQARTRSALWQLADGLVQEAARQPIDYRSAQTRQCAGNCSLLNQSLMELGAVTCTARQPSCHLCPARDHCQARRDGRTETLPSKPARAKAIHRSLIVFVVEHRGRLLIRQRPAGQVNAHLWEFPSVEVGSDPGDLRHLAWATLGIQPTRLDPLCTLKFSITKSRITARVVRVHPGRPPRRLPMASRWLRPPALAALAFSAAHLRILAVLNKARAAKTTGMKSQARTPDQ